MDAHLAADYLTIYFRNPNVPCWAWASEYTTRINETVHVSFARSRFVVARHHFSHLATYSTGTGLSVDTKGSVFLHLVCSHCSVARFIHPMPVILHPNKAWLSSKWNERQHALFWVTYAIHRRQGRSLNTSEASDSSPPTEGSPPLGLG